MLPLDWLISELDTNLFASFCQKIETPTEYVNKFPIKEPKLWLLWIEYFNYSIQLKNKKTKKKKKKKENWLLVWIDLRYLGIKKPNYVTIN